MAAQEAISTTEDQVPFSSPDVQREAGLGAFSASFPFHLASGTLMSPLFGKYSKAGLPRAVAEAATEFVEGGADEFARQHGTNPLTGQDYDLRAIANAAGLEAVGGFGSSVLAKGLWSVVEPKEKKLRSAADGDAKKQVEIMNAMVNPLDPTVTGAKDTVQRGTNARAVADLMDNFFPAEKLDGPAQQNASDMFSQIVKFTGNDKLHGGNISDTIMQMPREELFKSFPYLQDSGKNIRDDRDVVAAKNDLLKYTNAFLERSFPGADFLIRLLERSIKPENAREAAVYETLNQIFTENGLEQGAVFGEGIDRYIKPGMTQKEQIDARAQAVNDLAVVSRRLEFDDVWEMWNSAYRKSPQVDSAIVIYDKSLQAGSPPFRAIRETQREDPKMREEEDKDDEIRMRNIQIALEAVRAKEEFDQQTMAGQSSARPQKFSDSAAEAAAETETAAEETAAEKPAAEEVAEEVEPPRTVDEINAAAIEDTAIASAAGGRQEFVANPLSVYPPGDRRYGEPFSVDPKTYQYKGGADAESGEVDPMNADYDTHAAGFLLVHERESGERFIAHGHHRNALAKRAAKAGKPAGMNIVLLREKDQVTIADAVAWAAMQNLRDGQLNSPLDVAKALRNPKTRGVIERQLGERTGKSGALIRSAMGLAKLSEEALGFVATGKVAENFAAEVGHAELDDKNQMGVLQAFEKNPPSTLGAAKMVAAMARKGTAQRREGKQGGLEGLVSKEYDNEMVKMADLLDRTIKSILSDAKAFGRVAGSEKEIGAVSDTETAEKISGGSESIRGKNKVMAAFLENSVGANTTIYHKARELARDIIAEKMTMTEAVKVLRDDLSALYEKYGDKLAEDTAWEVVAMDAENAAVADDDAPPPVNENQGGIFSMSGLVGRSPREFAAQFPNQRTAKSRRADDDTAAEGDAYDQFVQRALESIMETLYPKQGDRNSFRGANPAKQAFSALRRAGKGDVGRGMRSHGGGRKAEEARMAVAIFELVDAFERIGGIPANVAIYSMFEGGPKDQPFRNAVGHTDLENRIISIAMNSTEMTDDGEILIDNTDRKNNIGAVGLHEGWHLLWSILPPDTKKQIVVDAKKWLDDIPPEIRRLIEESASRSGAADSDSVMADETVAYLLQTAFQTETPAAVRTDEGIIDRAKRRISQTRLADFLQGLFENGLPRPLITDSPVFRKFNDALVQAGKNWRRVGLLSSADVVNAFFGGAFAKQLELARAAGGRAAAMTSLRAAVRGAPKSEILRVFSPNELIISVGDDDDMQPDSSLPPRDSLGRFSLVVPKSGGTDGRFSLVSPKVAGVADDAIRRAEKEWTARLGGDFSQKNIAVVLDEDDDFVERVWRDTGIILSVDGKYRAELRDDWITPSAVREMRDFFRGKRGGRWAGEAPITDFFPNAPSQLTEVEVSLGERGHGGSYSHDYKTINIKRGTMNRMDELISVLIHEVQHAWQSMLYGKGFGNWTKSSEDVRNMDDDDLRRAADAILAIVPSPDEKRAGGKIANVGRDVILATQRDLRVIKKHEDENGNKFAEKYADSRRSVLGDFYGYWAKFKETEAREVEARVGKDAKWRAENPPKYDGIPANLVVVGRLNPGGESAADYFYTPSGERVVKPKQEPERGQGGLFSVISQTGIRPLRDLQGMKAVRRGDVEKIIAGVQKAIKQKEEFGKRADLFLAAAYSDGESKNAQVQKLWAGAIERARAKVIEGSEKKSVQEVWVVGTARTDLKKRAQDAERQARSAIFEKVYLEVLENVLSELYSRDDIFYGKREAVSYTPQEVWDAAAGALEKRNVRGFRGEEQDPAHGHNIWDHGSHFTRDVAFYDDGKNFDKKYKPIGNARSWARHSHHDGDVFYFRVEEKETPDGLEVLYGNIQSDIDDNFLTEFGDLMATRKNLARIMLSGVMQYHAENYPNLPVRIHTGDMMDVAQGGELRQSEVVSEADFPAAMKKWEETVAEFSGLERGDQIADGVVSRRISDNEVAIIPTNSLQRPREFAGFFVESIEEEIANSLYYEMTDAFAEYPHDFLRLKPNEAAQHIADQRLERVLRRLESDFDWMALTNHTISINDAAGNIALAFINAYKNKDFQGVSQEDFQKSFDIWKPMKLDRKSFVSNIAEQVETSKDGKYAMKTNWWVHLVHKTKPLAPVMESRARTNPHPKGTGNFGRFDWYENQIPRSAKELGVSVKRVPMTNSDNQTADAWEISAEDAAKVAGRPLEAFSIAAPPPRKRAGVTGADLYSALGSPPVVISLSSRRTGRIATKLLRGAGGAYFAGDDSRGRRWVADSLSRANVPPMMTAAAALEVARSFAKPAAVFADNGGGEVWEGKWAGRDGAGAPVLRGRWARDGKNRIVLESGAPGNAVFALAQAAQISGEAIVVTPDMPPVRRALFDFGVRFFLRGGDLHIRRDALAFYANRDGMAWGTRTAAARRQAVRDNGRFSVFSQSGIRPLRALQGMNAVRRADIEKIIGSVRKTIKQKEEFGKRAGLFRAVRQSDGETKNPQEMKLWAGAMERAKAKAAKIGEKDFFGNPQLCA